MKQLKLNRILGLLGLEPLKEDITIDYISDNIKKVRDNSLIFHVIKDEEMNFKKFKRMKNCYIVTDQPLLVDYKEERNKFFFVSNIAEAYMKVVRYYRSMFKMPVVAVTGTCGKTTTKEMIAQVLKQDHKVVHTISSKNNLRFNNDYLFAIDESTEYGVFETAITHPGNLLHECDIYKPDIGIITTIGIDHLNWCKTMDIYIRSKAEMLIGLENKKVLIVNYDDSNIRRIDFSNYKGKIITFGFDEGAEYQAINLEYHGAGMKFTLVYNRINYDFFVPGFGDHNVLNALACIAAVHRLGFDFEYIRNGLKKFEHIRSHTEEKKGINKSIIIDDTWSSNPTSVKAALKVIHSKGKDMKKIAVLGKINYLGDKKEAYYDMIARLIIKYKIDMLVSLDKDAQIIGKYALKYGLKKENCLHFENNKELVDTFKNILDKETIVLFKFSMLDKEHKKVIEDLVE